MGISRVLAVVVVAGTLASCEAPPQSPSRKALMVSGRVYQLGTAEFGEPMLPDVLITIEQGGLRHTALTNGTGFYAISGASGVISISAMKAGFQVNQLDLDLVDHIVLNFSLTPDELSSASVLRDRADLGARAVIWRYQRRLSAAHAKAARAAAPACGRPESLRYRRLRVLIAREATVVKDCIGCTASQAFKCDAGGGST